MNVLHHSCQTLVNFSSVQNFFYLAFGQMEANFADGLTYGFVAHVAVYECFCIGCNGRGLFILLSLARSNEMAKERYEVGFGP